MRNIVLIGFMGTGKTAVGERLAGRLGWAFVDTDGLVEAREGRTIPEIFQSQGEAYFRHLESQVVGEVCLGERQVIATGGGVVLRPENRKLLREAGVVISLVAEPEALLARLGSAEGRPLLAGNVQGNLLRLLREREPLYRDADIVLDVTGKELEDVVNECLDRLGERVCETLTVRTRERVYPVHVGEGIVSLLGWALGKIASGRRVALLTHRDLHARYGEMVVRALEASGYEVTVITIPSGERTKSLRTAQRLYDCLASSRIDRSSILVAMGGGVIGDVGGFVASTYMRGIPLVHLPTTLLAQVDSSIGGKTAVNHPRAKNLVGTFYQPHMVMADVAFLRSLPKREVRAGLAEVVKAGVVGDPDLFLHLEQNHRRILSLETNPLVESIKRAVAVKVHVVEEDERDQNRRMVLNYGHTIGHALEVAAGFRYRHGEAVAIGMALEAEVARRMGLFPEESARRQEELLRHIGLPTRPRAVEPMKVLEAMALDKKARGGKLRFALPVAIGHVEIVEDVPTSILEEVLRDGEDPCGTWS
ncbi:MAG: 3-dehydroquinate synthase [Armatimonadota bacterium]|nr:3-dehydroquinate synthase [Armatimonadota bacterium]MDR5702006.1 3-dehydroquinate synthase [Armatimonadota bacterium]